METEILDKLYLELSQVTNAKTAREIELYDMLCSCLAVVERKGEHTNWDSLETSMRAVMSKHEKLHFYNPKKSELKGLFC